MENLEKLKQEIEVRFGRKILNPADFDALYLSIKKEIGKEVSVSTLKRIFGYVKYESKPRLEILSILSRYLGFTDWQDFINSDNISDTSDFLNKGIIESKNLKKGTRIRINWAPKRECEFKYVGEEKFLVLKAQNSKIQKEDIINCSVLAKGEPLLCSSIQRNGKIIAECYVAARQRGIQSLSIIKSNG